MKHWLSDLLPFRRNPLNFMLSIGERAKGPVERAYLGPTPIWMVTDPELVKSVLKAPEEQIDKGRLVYKLRKVLGVSSLSLSGEEHRRRRGVLHGAFARGVANQYVPEMTAIVRRFIVQLMQMKSFDAHEMTSRLSLRLVSAVMFGKDVLQEADEEVIVQAVARVEDDLSDEMFRVMPVMPWEQIRRARERKAARAVMGAVVQRVRGRSPEGTVVKSLEALNLSDEDLSNEILTMIVAGHHTTGNASAWLLYHLSVVPGLKDKIASEAMALQDESGEISASKLPHASVSLAAVKETLRLYPSAHWFARDAKCDQEIGGKKVRKGDTVLIPTWLYHRSPAYWDRPSEFDLNRDFTSKAFLPFGAGVRACTGMGLALLELQLMAIEFSVATEIRVLSQVPAPQPKSAITLLPPPIELQVTLAEEVPQARAAA